MWWHLERYYTTTSLHCSILCQPFSQSINYETRPQGAGTLDQVTGLSSSHPSHTVYSPELTHSRVRGLSIYKALKRR